MKLLIVEDDKLLLKTLVDRFVQEGFEVLQAEDGEQGLALSLKERPNLILLDIILPRMDGMTMMSRLRDSGPLGKNMPIIVLTNLSADDKILEGVTEDKPAYYLVKTDWTLDGVVQKVKERLGMIQ